MRRHLVHLAALAGGLTACDNPASKTLVTSPSAPSFDVEGLPTIVSGSGHIEAGDGLRIFTFHAVQGPDGSVEGSYQIRRTDLGVAFTVDVSCLSVIGNVAWVGGHIASSTQPGVIEGTVSYFYAIDNGEGSEASPDVVSLARVNDVPGADVEFCTTRPLLLPRRNVLLGGVQIR